MKISQNCVWTLTFVGKCGFPHKKIIKSTAARTEVELSLLGKIQNGGVNKRERHQWSALCRAQQRLPRSFSFLTWRRELVLSLHYNVLVVMHKTMLIFIIPLNSDEKKNGKEYRRIVYPQSVIIQLNKEKIIYHMIRKITAGEQ